MSEPRVESFAAGDVELDCGDVLPDVEILYATYGEPSPSRDNVIVFPTRYGGTHTDNEFMIGPGHALDTSRYCVVVPNMLGNGASTSPSNAPPGMQGQDFPLVTIADNVRLQRRLLTERLEVGGLRMAVGFSMGAQQAYHWAALYPDDVETLGVICGAARTAPHTHVFLEGMRAALCADQDWDRLGEGVVPERGLRALGRAWAGWAISQAWYRRRGWAELGYESLEDFLVRYWEATYLGRDAGNLVSMIRTWQECDIAANESFGGNYEAALAAIRAPTVLMPGLTDLYFPPEDSAAEAELLADAELAVIPSDWGHYAGAGKDPADVAFIDERLAGLLEG
jgi:homoserine O-acetyltransferase